MSAAPQSVGLTLRIKVVALCAMAGAILTSSSSAQSGTEPFGRNTGETSTRPLPIERLPIFFPPTPPPFGQPPARGVSSVGRNPAPRELAPFVCEFFYPALGTRLATRTLTEKQRAEVESYHAAKLSLQNELRGELERLRAMEPAARAEGLLALSRRQTPKIAELEKSAELLRRDLVSSDQNWSAHREWHLSDKTRRGFSPLEIAQVMRAYAFYNPHLLPGQRRLLREIAIELIFAADNTVAATAAQPHAFFPPELARVTFPTELPAEVAAKIGTFQTRRSALKKELYDAVHAADGAGLSFLRSSPIKALADKQATRLAELDVLAEDIRRGLTTIPDARPQRSPLPVALDTRVATMIQNVIAAQKEATARIDVILAAAKDLPVQATYRFDGDGLKFLVVPGRGSRGGGRSGNSAAQVDEVRAKVSAVADDYGRRIADMLNEKDAIRREIGESLGLAKADAIDRALFAAMRAATLKETEGTFSEYRVAVFEPGLSPEQRRLLFDGVVERFELPLPRGELQPTLRAESW